VRAGIPVKHWPVKGINFTLLEDTGDTIRPPPIAPQLKHAGYLRSIGIDIPDMESDVEEDENMKPSRSSQTEHGQGKKPWYPQGMGNDPSTTKDLNDSDDKKPKRLKGKPLKVFNGNRNNTHVFLHDFELFMSMNIGADIERHPFKKSAYFLSLIQGLDTEGWADNINDLLKEARKDRSIIPSVTHGLRVSLGTAIALL
jgi:hypothetical protein